MDDPLIWQNRAPGNLDILLPEVITTEVGAVVRNATRASASWAALPLHERQAHLQLIHTALEKESEVLATQISLEIGKPLAEARGELGAVLAKFALTFEDSEKYLADLPVNQGPHPAAIRRRSRGPAAVIGPFNFPLHLGNGAILPHLLAGNTVIYKPSPYAPLVAQMYGDILARHLPEGVFQIAQGMGETSRKLCLHPHIRSVCFTGSVAVGRSLAIDLVGDFSKDLALELGGKNALFVAEDADLPAAAQATADGMSLTAGQRCNGTSRVFVVQSVAHEFSKLLRQALAIYLPADPTHEKTKLGPVISEAAKKRHENLIQESGAETFANIDTNLNGYYVLPAVVWKKLGDPLLAEEQFVPFLEVVTVNHLEDAINHHAQSEYGLSASIFTKSKATFERFVHQMLVGNVYANLPTTFSPSTLPFGGLKNSGNHHPGGRGFARFVSDEQAVQWTGLD